MTFESELRSYLLQAMRSAFIISPRFQDYKISQVDFPAFANLDEALKEHLQLMKEEETEQDLAEDLLGAEGKKAKELGGQDVLKFAGRGLGGPQSIIGMITPMIPYLVPMLIASGAAIQLFEWARGPGGPLDKRYLRDLMRETNNFMTRQLLRDTEVGNRQVIIQAQANFRNLGGAGNSNSLRQMRESGDRLSNIAIGVTDAARGLEKIAQ